MKLIQIFSIVGLLQATSAQYPAVHVINSTPYPVTGKIGYKSWLCSDDNYHLGPAPTGDYRNSRGLCLITDISCKIHPDDVPGCDTIRCTPYSSTGTSYSQFSVNQVSQCVFEVSRRVTNVATSQAALLGSSFRVHDDDVGEYQYQEQEPAYVESGCVNDLGPAMGMMAAEEIVVASDWFADYCNPMRRSKPPIDAEAECKQFAINYCTGHMSDAVDFKSICRETPPTYLLNSWANECPDEVSRLIPTPSPSPNPRSYDPVKEGYKAGTKAIDDFYGGAKSKCWGNTLDNEVQKLKYEKFPENKGTPDERAFNQSANIATGREAKKIKDKCFASASASASASANFVRLRGNRK